MNVKMKPVLEMSKAECIDQIFELLWLGIPPKAQTGQYESKRRYNMQHKDEAAIYNKDYYARNKPKLQAAQKLYRERIKLARENAV